MDKRILDSLIDKVNNGTATDDDLKAYNAYLNQATNASDSWNEQLLGKEDSLEAELLYRINTGIGQKPVIVIRLWPRIAVAASILLFLSIGGYFLLPKQAPRKQIVHNQPLRNDIAPGGSKAILTLANGKQIVLNNAQNGALAQQGAITISKTQSGQIVYTAGAPTTQNPQLITYNSIETPRGGQYHLTLSDGTNVWLNAASSIKYPVVFAGNERRVEITGEAYFEVEHIAAKPFRVVCNGQTVEDLGTHFNINAYSDEKAVKTTLLEGSVRVSSAGRNQMLKPGEQSLLENGNIRIADVDVNEVIAWKNGFFQFKDDNISDIMRQLGRWYDVSIKYEGNVPEREFSGEIPRNVNVSQVLDILSFEKIHFKIEGKTIIVTP